MDIPFSHSRLVPGKRLPRRLRRGGRPHPARSLNSHKKHKKSRKGWKKGSYTSNHGGSLGSLLSSDSFFFLRLFVFFVAISDLHFSERRGSAPGGVCDRCSAAQAGSSRC